MKRCRSILVIAVALFALSFAASVPRDLRAFSHDRPTILRSYPEAGSTAVPVETSIGITASKPFNAADATRNTVLVTGSRSGLHAGAVTLSLDGKTMIFTPANRFQIGETVQVTLSVTSTLE